MRILLCNVSPENRGIRNHKTLNREDEILQFLMRYYQCRQCSMPGENHFIGCLCGLSECGGVRIMVAIHHIVYRCFLHTGHVKNIRFLCLIKCMLGTFKVVPLLPFWKGRHVYKNYQPEQNILIIL